jgi:hypothetical protein
MAIVTRHVVIPCKPDGRDYVTNITWPAGGPFTFSSSGGYLYGEGPARARPAPDNLWVVAAVQLDSTLTGWVSFVGGEVLYRGDGAGLYACLVAQGLSGKATNYAVATGGPGDTVTVGHYSTATITGNGTGFAGTQSILTGGDGSTLTCSGGFSRATGGVGSTVTVWCDSQAFVGANGVAVGGPASTVKGGSGATLSIKWFNGSTYQTVTGVVGSGLTAGVEYRLSGPPGSTPVMMDVTTIPPGTWLPAGPR